MTGASKSTLWLEGLDDISRGGLIIERRRAERDIPTYRQRRRRK